jgi:hypothetical protein
MENPFKRSSKEQEEHELGKGTHFEEDSHGALHSGTTPEEAHQKRLEAEQGYK